MLCLTMNQNGRDHKVWLSDSETGDVLAEISLTSDKFGKVRIGIESPGWVRIERDCVKAAREEKDNVN